MNIDDHSLTAGLSWTSVLATALIDEPITSFPATQTVEEACSTLLAKNTSYLLITSTNLANPSSPNYHGLFDFADVNAFLLLATGTHIPTAEELEIPRLRAVINAAKLGEDILVKDVCNLSEKNPLVFLPADATLLSLVEIFSQGIHRVAIKDETQTVIKIITDRHLVQWFMENAASYPQLGPALESPLFDLEIGVSKHVVSLASEATVLSAMRLMSEQGVSSLAVMDHAGRLLSAVSVTDIGKLVAPAESRSVLGYTLTHFISMIKEPHGSMDGEDRHPVYSVPVTSTLGLTVQVLLATNAHRVFTTGYNTLSSVTPFPPSSPSHAACSSLTPTDPPTYGVVSVVDVLSVFARLGGIVGVDPSLTRHRRSSSASGHSGRGEHSAKELWNSMTHLRKVSLESPLSLES